MPTRPVHDWAGNSWSLNFLRDSSVLSCCPYGPDFTLKIFDFDENHENTNKNLKGVKSLKKYKHGFAIRTWKMINLLSKTDAFIKNDKFA